VRLVTLNSLISVKIYLVLSLVQLGGHFFLFSYRRRFVVVEFQQQQQQKQHENFFFLRSCWKSQNCNKKSVFFLFLTSSSKLGLGKETGDCELCEDAFTDVALMRLSRSHWHCVVWCTVTGGE